MSTEKPDNGRTREFRPTTIALKNKSTIFLLTLIIAVAGVFSYRSLPKELFPDVVIPTIMVKTIYPGNPPLDMENLITRPLENEINTISGIRILSSVSTQDNSDIFVEFQTDVDIKQALQDVKDAVDRVKPDLPADLPADPIVLDIDFSEFPIININLSGDFSIDELKRYADYLADEIEVITEISKVEITGIPEREIQVNVNPLLLDANELSFTDLENAIMQENISIAGGSVRFDDNTRWAVRTQGEFTDVRQIADIVVKHEMGSIVHLRDVATVEDTWADPVSFARLDDQPVVSLQVVKKAGENLLSATAGIFDLIDRSKSNGSLPPDLTITITNDQSEEIRNQLSNLENSVILAVILVILVLYLFLGLKNALFVGLAIPLSMLSSFMVFGLLGIQINMIVLFSLILALGLLVDNAIVAVDNIYRYVERGYTVFEAAKRAIGEIALPIITSTATTLSAFLPLAFWSGIVGEFMKYMPLTLIIVLTSSLFVALIIIPVFSETFFKDPDSSAGRSGTGGLASDRLKLPGFVRPAYLKAGLIGVAAIAGIILHTASRTLAGNILILAAVIAILGFYVLGRLQRWFRNKLLPFNERLYSLTLSYALQGRRPYLFVSGTLVFLVVSISFFSARTPDVLFFPDNEPKFINIMAELPAGTDIYETDRVVGEIEERVREIIRPYRHIVKSVLTTVGQGSVGEMEQSGGDTPNRGRITVTFTEYEARGGINTNEIMAEISSSLIGSYPGVEFNIEKNTAGPPAGRPVNLEISGREFEQLISLARDIRNRIEESGIAGIEGLSMDLETDLPEITINIDRDRARRYGISTFAIANTIRTALFGNEVSSFKIGEEEFPIMLRLDDDYRHNLNSLMNQRISFRSQSSGQLMQVPVSAVASAEFGKTYGSVNRINMDRVITLSSNILPGYNATTVNRQIRELMEAYDMPPGYGYAFTGEQQEQEESMAFLITALMISVSLIALILVSQFNSVLKPFIIIGSVIFSTAGVFFGLALFNMEFVIIMTGVGIISLAGVVVNNAIVLIDYTDYLHDQKRTMLKVSEKQFLNPATSLAIIQQAGETRFRPVVLTAITTVLGLIPLAIGLNINFVTLMTELRPQIYFGGDNAAFWSPMSWTVIFGLTVATFLTLVIVPCMYQIILSTQRKVMVWLRGSDTISAE
ncbi:MAG: efflux RND transporter permease subunit [Marinilabiliales bacterium]|nr:MAG: efflux RND transporter permease subunit [Marinilabiliales bacterium]